MCLQKSNLVTGKVCLHICILQIEIAYHKNLAGSDGSTPCYNNYCIIPIGGQMGCWKCLGQTFQYKALSSSTICVHRHSYNNALQFWSHGCPVHDLVASTVLY